MSNVQILLTILVAALATAAVRFLPFLLFSGGRKPPAFVTWLGRQLPRAAMAMLVVYCLKDVSFTAAPHWLPALVAVAVTVCLHVWKKQMILSICGGTAVYMLLIRLIL